ncbi:unnamed protein product [Laminaria digitata]
MVVDIDEVLRLEAELNSHRANGTCVSLDAMANILKYLQVKAVRQYEQMFDGLYYELNKEGGLECLRTITPVWSGAFVQPKVLELQDCGEDDQLENELQFFVADAQLAKQCLDNLIAEATQDLEKCEAKCVDVKSLESTRWKVRKFCDGDVRKVADMARLL